MLIPLYFFVFVLGSALASGFMCLADRLARNEPWLSGSSHCDHCKQSLRALQLIPILSYLGSRGRTSCCNKHISTKYPFFELFGGLLFLALTWHGLILGGGLWLATNLLIGAFTLFAVYYDGRYGFVSPPISLIASLLVFLLLPLPLMSKLIGLLVGGGFFGAQFLILGKKKIGRGDIYFGLFLGVVAGWPLVIPVIAFGYIFGLLEALYLLLQKKKSLHGQIHLGPPLFLGLLFIYLLDPILQISNLFAL